MQAGQCVFVECALCLQSLFQQNKTSVSFREIAQHALSLEIRNDLVQTIFLLKYIMWLLLARLTPLHWENVD